MARTFDGTTAFAASTLPAHSIRAVATVRLVLGLVALLGAIIFLEGTSWDIQWHSFIGRDRTLIPPHLMMLGGVTLSGIAGLLAVLIESWWARRNPLLAGHNLRFATLFNGPLGAYIVGYAALLAAVAFPLDAYWHTLYGIDVSIWAPFHVMFISSMGVVALGALYMLISAAHLASNTALLAAGLKRAANLGAALALATLLSLLTLLIFDALDNSNQIGLGFINISVFPLLASMLVAFVFVVATYALAWRWAATLVSGFYVCLAVIMAIFVQPATDWLLTIEGLSYKESPPATSIVALEWFITPVVVAILIDVFMRRARRKDWSRRKTVLVLALCALMSGILPVIVLYPLLPALLFLQAGIAGFLASAILGFGGAWLGVFFAQNTGETLNVLER
ncbi:MAG TPA: hypothetical protein VGD98_15810 [Ktedonobacteraceae bacterium]